jgi:hypothetical protein
MKDPERQVDRQRYQDSIAWLNEILKDISETATQVSTWRCPYKDAQDLCTAKFGCRNQLRTQDAAAAPTCTGSDDLDYRKAWEV